MNDRAGYQTSDNKDQSADKPFLWEYEKREQKLRAEMKHMNDQWARLHKALGTKPEDDWDEAPFSYITMMKHAAKGSILPMSDQSAEARLAALAAHQRGEIPLNAPAKYYAMGYDDALAATPDRPCDILERARNAADVIIAINGQHKMSRFEIADLIAKHFSK